MVDGADLSSGLGTNSFEHVAEIIHIRFVEGKGVAVELRSMCGSHTAHRHCSFSSSTDSRCSTPGGGGGLCKIVTLATAFVKAERECATGVLQKSSSRAVGRWNRDIFNGPLGLNISIGSIVDGGRVCRWTTILRTNGEKCSCYGAYQPGLLSKFEKVESSAGCCIVCKRSGDDVRSQTFERGC